MAKGVTFDPHKWRMGACVVHSEHVIHSYTIFESDDKELYRGFDNGPGFEQATERYQLAKRCWIRCNETKETRLVLREVFILTVMCSCAFLRDDHEWMLDHADTFSIVPDSIMDNIARFVKTYITTSSALKTDVKLIGGSPSIGGVVDLITDRFIIDVKCSKYPLSTGGRPQDGFLQCASYYAMLPLMKLDDKDADTFMGPTQYVIFNPVSGDCYELDVSRCDRLAVYKKIRELNTERPMQLDLCKLWT